MISYTYNRYLWLLNTLLIYRRLTFEEIQNKWQHSIMYEGKSLNLRTFHMHRNAVQEMFQINIECDKADGYRYYIANVGSFAHDQSRQLVLACYNQAEMVQQGRALRHRICLEDIPAGSEYLSTVVTAMQQGSELEIQYQTFYHDAPSTYHIQPYCLRVYRQRWYILGMSHEHEGLRHFALDRTLAMQLTDQSFQLPANFNPDDYYRHASGIWVNDQLQPEHVVLRAYDVQARYLASLPLHCSQKVVYQTPEYTDFQYDVCITPDFVMELQSHGSTLQVLEPESLRAQLIDEARALLQRYGEGE